MHRKEQETYLKNAFGQAFEEEMQPHKLEETIKICNDIIRMRANTQEEERTGFWQYLSDVFRFDGLSILGLQAATLLLLCLNISHIKEEPAILPVFMPLFVLALLPSLFRGRRYNMSEIEAATRASGAQIILAKLVLAGSANLICITILLWFELYLQHSVVHLGQLILYALVPYLICMVLLLRNIRLQKRENIQICILELSAFCLYWGAAAKMLPGLYEASAAGIWIIAFLVFGAFFLKEIIYITEMRKRGKMYGIIA